VSTLGQHIADALSLGSMFALVALGIALIFGIMNLVNFAHGELVLAGGYTMYLLVGHVPWALIIPLVIVVCALVAVLMERVAFRPVRGADPATLLVTSFAVSYFIQHLTILVISPQPKGVAMSSRLLEPVSVVGVTISLLQVLTTVTTIVLLLALAVLLKRTAIGVRMRAAAEDFRMARLLGVRANAVIASAFALSGLLAGVVSIFWVAQTGSVSSSVGLAPLLAGVVGAVIGGMSSLPGAVLGGYVLGALTVTFDVVLPEALRVYRDAFVFGVVLVVLVVRPQGILSRGSEARV
jgi:branched-chain amino acid transport system permease protein